VVEAQGPAGWRGIDELAALVGAYVWVERRIFSITGAWATSPSAIGKDADVARDSVPRDSVPRDADASDADARGSDAHDADACGSNAHDAEARVWCAAVSRRHGALAGRWAERLPFRAGVDAGALVAAPPGALDGALDALAASPLAPGLDALVAVLLPRLDAVYVTHLRTGSRVSEPPVLEVLVEAHRTVAGEIRGGQTLVEGMAHGREQSRDLGDKLERAFAETDVFPAVRPS
jgi:hypothetical protein